MIESTTNNRLLVISMLVSLAVLVSACAATIRLCLIYAPQVVINLFGSHH